MKFSINDPNTDANGTSYKGSITTDYKTLVELFGEPKAGSADKKTTCEWVLEFEDGTVATIHDWKTNATPISNYEWSVGGHDSKVLKYLEQITNIKTTAFKF